MEESKQADEDCTHERVMTWRLEETNEPAGLWSCAACGLKFVPLTVATSLATQAQQGEPPDSYVRNCQIIGTRGETLFHGVNDSVYASLDGYTIMTNERYYALTHGSATPSAPARQAVRMLTDAEFQDTRDKWIATGIGSLSEAIQRKFCEVNALPLEQQEGGK